MATRPLGRVTERLRAKVAEVIAAHLVARRLESTVARASRAIDSGSQLRLGADSAEGFAEECGIPIRLYKDGHRRHMAHSPGWIGSALIACIRLYAHGSRYGMIGADVRAPL